MQGGYTAPQNLFRLRCRGLSMNGSEVQTLSTLGPMAFDKPMQERTNGEFTTLSFPCGFKTMGLMCLQHTPSTAWEQCQPPKGSEISSNTRCARHGDDSAAAISLWWNGPRASATAAPRQPKGPAPTAARPSDSVSSCLQLPGLIQVDQWADMVAKWKCCLMLVDVGRFWLWFKSNWSKIVSE